MVMLLPTPEENKRAVTNILKEWNSHVQKSLAKTHRNGTFLTIDKLKESVKALSFFLQKIISRPLDNSLRKINCYNKQYTSLKKIPRFQDILTTIGYQQSSDEVFWSIPVVMSEEKLASENTFTVNPNKIDYAQAYRSLSAQSKKENTISNAQKSEHQMQCEYLLCFYILLKHLFDETLPKDLQTILDSSLNQNVKEIVSSKSVSAHSKVINTDRKTVTECFFSVVCLSFI
ncbi:hypothetical protein RFI_09838 [Reticulomyxa filosa]|uniref:Uncharacterized protein n=1 Tax=Reticulomyxa filosa TaxID=46433 RepID=X6NPI8_RETFI|nr:hypothetical protein RFI_09838 [Reticulomyxa filosa]|eukprot:ETO27292.1 hypothetical protein RFI_09838 [Reticulomyxa filosa]